MRRTIALIVFATLIANHVSAGIAHAQEAARIDATAWRADLRYVAEELPRRHPNLFYRMTEASWDSAVAAVDRGIDTMSLNQALVAFMQLVALPRDGHTTINPMFDRAIGARYYPVQLEWFEDGVFVRSAAPQLAAIVGARVVRVGRVTTEQALAAVASTLPHENEWWLRAWGPGRLMIPEIMDGLGLVEDPERMVLVVERDGRQENVELHPAGRFEPQGHNPMDAIDRSGWLDMRGAAEPALWLRQPGWPYWMEYVNADSTLYVSYRAVVSIDNHPRSNTEFWRGVFAATDSLPLARLVLDLRENIGGNSFFNRQVIRGIVARPALDRADRLFVIIGSRTFSAAMNLVLDLERWTNATFVGEPTGNATVFFGDHLSLVLQGSGITVNVSSLPWYPDDPRDHRDSIVPRIYAPLASGDYRDNKDPAMRAILRARSEPSFAARMEEALQRGDEAAAAGALEDARLDVANRFRNLESEVNALGYELLRTHRAEAAIAAFTINTRAYPKSANTWDSLGEALLASGHREDGLAAYRKALAIDPQFASAQQVLERLGEKGNAANGKP